jgi:hypothetical protein
MQDNLRVALATTERLEEMEDKSRDLERDADLWRHNAGQVRRQMCWSHWRANILIAVIVVVILLVIIVPIAVSVRNASSN